MEGFKKGSESFQGTKTFSRILDGTFMNSLRKVVSHTTMGKIKKKPAATFILGQGGREKTPVPDFW